MSERNKRPKGQPVEEKRPVPGKAPGTGNDPPQDSPGREPAIRDPGDVERESIRGGSDRSGDRDAERITPD